MNRPLANEVPGTNSDAPDAAGTNPGAPDAAKASVPGLAEWVAARRLRHNEIPDDAADGRYLELVVKSAELGYAPALSKLGVYALRRGGFIEAYYWFSRARLHGLATLDEDLRCLRRDWQRAGCPPVDTEEDRSTFGPNRRAVALALLDRDSGRNIPEAKAFLAQVKL